MTNSKTMAMRRERMMQMYFMCEWRKRKLAYTLKIAVMSNLIAIMSNLDKIRIYAQQPGAITAIKTV